MKKIICTLLILILSFNLIACDTDNSQAPSKEEPTEIILTEQNIKQYLTIEGKYGKIERDSVLGIATGSSDFTFSINPTVPGNFYNTEIELQVKLTYRWEVKSSDPAYSEKDGYLTTVIKIPANGTKEETHDLFTNGYVANHDNQNITIKILSVKGTFQPST